MPKEKDAPKLNIHQRILNVMKAVSYVQKENKKVNNQYTFVSHDAVTAAIQPYLVENGIVVIPSVLEHSQEWTEYEGEYNGKKFTKFRGLTTVRIEVKFVNSDDPEDCFAIQYVGTGIDEQDKGVGKALSYAKKYAFLQVFQLATGDDPERDMLEHKPAQKKHTMKKGNMSATEFKNAIAYIVELKDSAEHLDDIDALKNSPEWKTLKDEAKLRGELNVITQDGGLVQQIMKKEKELKGVM